MIHFNISAILNLFHVEKYHVRMVRASIPLARYEIANALWKSRKIINGISKEEVIELVKVIYELTDSMAKIEPSKNSILKLS